MKMLNKKGSSYVFICAVLVVLCLVLSVFIMFVNAFGITKEVRNNVENIVDGYIMENAVEIYDSIKQGKDSSITLDTDDVINKLCNLGPYERNGELLIHKDRKGEVDYKISIPTFIQTQEESLKISVSLVVYYPLNILGGEIIIANIPITINSGYTEKF